MRRGAAPPTRSTIAHGRISNSIELAPPYGVLVTGSNMSGKTTFLRTIGVTAVLAQTINTCLASSYEAPVYHVRSCIGRSDDLLSGKSYYMAEVDAVLALVRASARQEPHLFLFDELFRGTNAVERVAAGEAVLAELLSPREWPAQHVVIAATHDGELVDLLRERYAPYHFTDRVEGDRLVFDYRLKAGPATTRNAIALLRLNGAPERLVTRALARAEALDRLRRA
jgi:DNA mismatch repair ATPase MutS